MTGSSFRISPSIYNFNPHRLRKRWRQFYPKITRYFCSIQTNLPLISSDLPFSPFINLLFFFLFVHFSGANPASWDCLLPIRTFCFLQYSIFSPSYSPFYRSWYRYFFNTFPNTRQTVIPINPSRKIIIAAPEPFPCPNNIAAILSAPALAINGSQTWSTIPPPRRNPTGIVKNCKVFRQA